MASLLSLVAGVVVGFAAGWFYGLKSAKRTTAETPSPTADKIPAPATAAAATTTEDEPKASPALEPEPVAVSSPATDLTADAKPAVDDASIEKSDPVVPAVDAEPVTRAVDPEPATSAVNAEPATPVVGAEPVATTAPVTVVAEAEPAATTELITAADAELTTETHTITEAEPVAETEPETAPIVKAEPVVETEPTTDRKPEPVAAANVDASEPATPFATVVSTGDGANGAVNDAELVAELEPKPTVAAIESATAADPATAETEAVAATEPVAKPAPKQRAVRTRAAKPKPAAEPVAEPAAAVESVAEPAAAESVVAEPVVAAPVVAEPVFSAAESTADTSAAVPGIAGADEVAAVPAPVAVAGAPVEPDDLTKIAGIGPKMAMALAAGGITTYQQLADSDVPALRAAVTAAGMRLSPTLPTWPDAAKKLVDTNS